MTELDEEEDAKGEEKDVENSEGEAEGGGEEKGGEENGDIGNGSQFCGCSWCGEESDDNNRFSSSALRGAVSLGCGDLGVEKVVVSC